MTRHADFAVVASMRMSSVPLRAGPYFFPLPQTIGDVTFGGLVQIADPTVELHPNPQDLVTLHFAFFSTFNATVGGGPVTQWRVRLDGAISAGFFIGPVNGQIVLRIDTSTVNFQPLIVTRLGGPPLPPAVVDALQSPEFAAAVSAAVKSLPTLTVTQLMPAQFSHTQPATFKDAGLSLFDWFTISFSISRVELRVFEGAVTVGVDFAGITNGDRNALVDLTRTKAGGVAYVRTITPSTTGAPILVGTPFNSAADFAFSFNIGVLGHLIEHQMSPQIAGTSISKEAAINWIRAGYSRFEKPLRGDEDGLVIRIGASAKGIDADVAVYLQPFLRTYDGPTDFIGPDAWLLFVGRVDIDLPWWADLLIGALQSLAVAISLVVTFPAAISIRGMALLEDVLGSINDAFAKGDPGNIASHTQLTMQNAVYDAKLPQYARYISVTADTLDIGLGAGIEHPVALPAAPTGGAKIIPETWSVYDRQPIQTAVQLDPAWQKLGNNLQVTWEVRRQDTNAVIVTGSKAYNSPGGNGVFIPHHSKELYLVSDFVIHCRLNMILGNQLGAIWTGQQTLHIEDLIDRRHSFVEWGPKAVHFMNTGTKGKYWHRVSRSRIHRTAVAARCKMLHVAVSLRRTALQYESQGFLIGSKYPAFRYKEALPFSWDHLNGHRKELCEYCFFHGPEKTNPLPRDDWFEPFEKPSIFEFEQIHISDL